MKLIAVLLLMICNVSFSQTGENNWLYLENQRNNRIKKIRLDAVMDLRYCIDTTIGDRSSITTWHVEYPQADNFQKEQMEFRFSGVDYYLYDDNDTATSYISSDHSTYEPITGYFNYTSADPNVDIYLKVQTKPKFVLRAIGGTFLYAALFNALVVAPLTGLNNGSLQGYSFQRLWRGELYSAVGFAIGIPLFSIFDSKYLYFQENKYPRDTWRVVDGK